MYIYRYIVVCMQACFDQYVCTDVGLLAHVLICMRLCRYVLMYGYLHVWSKKASMVYLFGEDFDMASPCDHAVESKL